jgi:uncharacterized protein YpmB
MKQQTNNKWRNAFIATLIIVAIIVGGFLIINQWGKQYYNGIQYGVNQTIQEIALSQVQTGNILITNGTAITTMPITQICQNLIDAQEVKK